MSAQMYLSGIQIMLSFHAATIWSNSPKVLLMAQGLSELATWTHASISAASPDDHCTRMTVTGIRDTAAPSFIIAHWPLTAAKLYWTVVKVSRGIVSCERRGWSREQRGRREGYSFLGWHWPPLKSITKIPWHQRCVDQNVAGQLSAEYFQLKRIYISLFRRLKWMISVTERKLRGNKIVFGTRILLPA